MDFPIRINRYLAQKQYCSRREADSFIKKKLVEINGRTALLGDQVKEEDKVEVLGEAEETQQNKVTIVVYKPRGIVSSKNSSEGKTIFEFLPQFVHLNTVGRLDKESEGLILLSNDGVITAAVTGKEHLIEKEYEVSVREKLHNWQMKRMGEGILLDKERTLPARTKLLNPHKYILIIREGKNHQVRRMAAAVNLTITKLKRTRIGMIRAGGLKIGKYRNLSPREIAILKKAR